MRRGKTREEAIKMLKEKKQTFIDEWADLDDIVEIFDMAIEALSVDGDLISRAEVLYLIDDAWVRGTNLCTADLLVDEIKSLQSTEAVQGWIPVSERLPEEREEAITILKDLPFRIFGEEYAGAYAEAIDMAISALKAPTTADAIRAIRKQISFTKDKIKDGHDGEFEHGIIRGCQYSIRLIREIEALPSADRPTESTNTPTVFIDREEKR